MIPVDVNIIAVLIAAVAAMVVGFIWYSPSLFGNEWMKLAGIKMDEASKQEMPKMYFITFVLAVITAYVMAHVLSYSQAATTTMGIQAGFWMWLGFAMPPMAAKMLFSKNKSMKLFFIDTGHTLATFIVIGAVLVMWG